jgi:DNA-binding NarL/FixJ family response regulator
MSSVGATIDSLIVDRDSGVLLASGGDMPVRLRHSERPLTEMDALVLEGVAAGVPTTQLAAKVYLSRGGVEYHVTRLLREFRVSNRTALVSMAYATGILAVGQWPPCVVRDFVK